MSTLYDGFVYLPRNGTEWKHELESSLDNWEFPCVGVWDGFHVFVSTKLKHYFSFKKRFSVSSMGFISFHERFLWAAVGAPGSTHDSMLLKSCDLFADIQQGHVFPNSALRTREYGDIPFTTVGDSAFPRYSWLMKPCNENIRDPRKRYLNKRLCSARVASDRACLWHAPRKVADSLQEDGVPTKEHYTCKNGLQSLAQYLHSKG